MNHFKSDGTAGHSVELYTLAVATTFVAVFLNILPVCLLVQVQKYLLSATD